MLEVARGNPGTAGERLRIVRWDMVLPLAAQSWPDVWQTDTTFSGDRPRRHAAPVWFLIRYCSWRSILHVISILSAGVGTQVLISKSPNDLRGTASANRTSLQREREKKNWIETNFQQCQIKVPRLETQNPPNVLTSIFYMVKYGWLWCVYGTLYLLQHTFK